VLAIVLVPLTIDFMVGRSKGRFSAREAATLMIQTILLLRGARMLAARLVAVLQHFANTLITTGRVLLLVGAIRLRLVARDRNQRTAPPSRLRRPGGIRRWRWQS
jgi:hypothetical protein